MVRSHHTSDFAANDLRSFRLAALILEATDCILLCGGRDLLHHQWQGHESCPTQRRVPEQVLPSSEHFAVVVGVHVDDHIRARVDAGEVSWYRLDQLSLEIV